MSISQYLSETYRLPLTVDSKLAKSLNYLPPRHVSVRLLEIMVEQNRGTLERDLKSVTKRLHEQEGQEISALLGVSASLPQVSVMWDNISGSAYYDEQEVCMHISAGSLLDFRKTGSTPVQLVHEYVHHLHRVQQPTIFGTNFRNLLPWGPLSKGNFLDEETIFQTEGLAQWASFMITGIDDGYTKTFDDASTLLEQKGGPKSWLGVSYVRNEFDNPYSLGHMVYDLVYAAGGTKAVRSLAFEKPLVRAELMLAYEKAAKALGTEVIPWVPRKKSLFDAAQEVITYGGSMSTPTFDLCEKIEDALSLCKDPKILNFLHGELAMVLDALYYHGVSRFCNTDRRVGHLRTVGGGDSSSISNDLFLEQWDVFVAPTDNLYKSFADRADVLYMGFVRND